MSKFVSNTFKKSSNTKKKNAKEKKRKVKINITDSTRPRMRITDVMEDEKDFELVSCHLSENTEEEYFLMKSSTSKEQIHKLIPEKTNHEDFIQKAIEAKSLYTPKMETPIPGKPEIHDTLYSSDPKVNEELLNTCLNEMKYLNATDRLTLDKYLHNTTILLEEEETKNGKLRFYYLKEYPSEKYPYHYSKRFSTFIAEYNSEVSTPLNYFGIQKTNMGTIEYEFSPICVRSEKMCSIDDIKGYFMAPVCRSKRKIQQMHMSDVVDSSIQLNQYIIGDKFKLPPEQWIKRCRAGLISKHEEALFEYKVPKTLDVNELEALFTPQVPLIDIPFGTKKSPLSVFFLNRAVILMCLQQLIKTYRNRVNAYRQIKKTTPEELRTNVEKAFVQNFENYRKASNKIVHKCYHLSEKYTIIHKSFGPIKIMAVVSNDATDVDRVVYEVKNCFGISTFIIRESNIQSMIDNSMLASSYVDLMNQSSKAFMMKLLYFLQPTPNMASMMSLTWMCQAGMSNVQEQTDKIFKEKVVDPHNSITMIKEEATRLAISTNNVDTLFSEILFKAPHMQSEANYLRCIKKLLLKFNTDVKPTIKNRIDSIRALMTKHPYPMSAITFDPKDLKCDFSDFSSSSSSSDFIIGKRIQGNIHEGQHSTNYSSGSMLQMANECGSSKMKQLIYFGLQQEPLIYIFVKDQTQGIREISVLNAAAKMLTQYAEMIARPLSRASNFDYILKEETKEEKVVTMFNRIRRKAEEKSKLDTEVVSITIDFSAWNQNIDLEIMASSLSFLMEQVGYPEEYIKLYNRILSWYASKKIEIPFTAIKNLFELYLEFSKIGPKWEKEDTLSLLLNIGEINENEVKQVNYATLSLKDKKKYAKYKKFYRIWDEMSEHVKDIFYQFSRIYIETCNQFNSDMVSVKEIHSKAISRLSKLSYVAEQEEGMGQGILGTSSSIMGTIAIYCAINELPDIFELDNYDFIETSDDCLIIAEVKNNFSEQNILDSLQTYLDLFHLKLSKVKCSVSCRPIVFFNSNRYVLENLGSRDFVEKQISVSEKIKSDIKEQSEEVTRLEREYTYVNKLLNTMQTKRQQYAMWKGNSTHRTNIVKERTRIFSELHEMESKLYTSLQNFRKANAKRIPPLMTSNCNVGKTYHINRYLKSMIMDNYSLMMEDEFSMHQALMETYANSFTSSSKVGYVLNTMHETTMYVLRYNWLFNNYNNWSPEVSCFRPGKEYNLPHKPMPAINQATRLDFLGLLPSRNKGLVIAFPTNNQLRSKENFQKTLLNASGNVSSMMNRNPRYANEINKIIMNGGKESRSSSSILSLSKKPFYKVETTTVFPYDKFLIDEMSVQIYDIYYTMIELNKSPKSRISKLSYFTCSVPKPLTIIDFAYEHLTFKQETIHDIVIQHIGEYVSMLLDNSFIKDNSQYVPTRKEFGYTHIKPTYGTVLKDYLENEKPACEWLMPQVKINGKYCQEGVLVKYHQGKDDMYKLIFYLLDDMIVDLDIVGKHTKELDMFIENDYAQLKLDSDFRISYQLNRPKWIYKTVFKEDAWWINKRQYSHKMERNTRSFVAMDKHLRYTHDLLDIIK